tara:strand:- start:19 stop:186 length:168 start_codon:yes stop_codon:yes gene_type:complete
MILMNSPFSIQDNNLKDLDNFSRKYPTFEDETTKQNISSKKNESVHRRRDLDSLG